MKQFFKLGLIIKDVYVVLRKLNLSKKVKYNNDSGQGKEEHKN